MNQTDCRHGDSSDFRGMNRTDLTQHFCFYACPDCGETRRLPRCEGKTTKGEQCRNPFGCWRHR